MDVSDGLAGDLTKMCEVSGVSARIELSRLPLSSAAAKALAAEPALIEKIMTGGDDYEILAAVPRERLGAFVDQAKAVSIAVTAIGEIVEGDGPPQLIAGDGEQLTFARGSFSHF
jgi:thiamine-monophosphate kinase